MGYAGGMVLARAIVEALGLPHVTKVVIEATVDEAAKVHATVLVPCEATGRLVEALKSFRLEPIEPEPDADHR
jgi:hypothetical protein